MVRLKIDINADVGEGIGNEADLFPLLSSCNIACGGHAGDLKLMNHLVKLALANTVKIGAHPSFPDKKNFGRSVLKMTDSELFKSLRHQILLLKKVANQNRAILNHIKPHGALYNLALVDTQTAKIIVEVVNSIDNSLKLYAPFKSMLSQVANENGVKVIFEAFADRNYNDDLTLVSRQNQDALIINKEAVLEQVKNMILNQKVMTINGNEIDIITDTICVHSDTHNALQIVKYLHENLSRIGIQID
ncbi:MAG: 5-oxoprolinase subunit PxpA [Flavobacteriaceae bacterium]|nr:5-oxoprolinase subunit PxpA [Flavobacteriaceae bacterium]